MKMILRKGNVYVGVSVGGGGGGAMCVGHILSQWSRVRSNAPSGVVMNCGHSWLTLPSISK